MQIELLTSRTAHDRLGATDGPKLVTSVQLELARKPNAWHRAEVQRLLVLRSVRRRGIGEQLMRRLDELAASTAARCWCSTPGKAIVGAAVPEARVRESRRDSAVRAECGWSARCHGILLYVRSDLNLVGLRKRLRAGSERRRTLPLGMEISDFFDPTAVPMANAVKPWGRLCRRFTMCLVPSRS